MEQEANLTRSRRQDSRPLARAVECRSFQDAASHDARLLLRNGAPRRQRRLPQQ